MDETPLGDEKEALLARTLDAQRQFRLPRRQIRGWAGGAVIRLACRGQISQLSRDALLRDWWGLGLVGWREEKPFSSAFAPFFLPRGPVLTRHRGGNI